MDQPTQENVSIKQAAALLQVHPSTIRRWVDDEKIGYVRTNRKAFKIPIAEVLRIQAENQISLIENVDGTVEFRHLHTMQQLDFLTAKIDFLQLIHERKELYRELLHRKEQVAIAEQAIYRIEQELKEHEQLFQWPNRFMNFEIENSPDLTKLKRYRALKEADLLPEKG